MGKIDGGRVGALKNGPTGKENTKIREELLKFFEAGRSYRYTAEKTKHNKKTVEKYWKEFRAERIFEIDESFIGRQRNAREAAIHEIDTDIDKLNDMISMANSKCMGEDATIWFNNKLKAIDQRNKLIQQRAAFDMIATVDVDVDRLILEENNAKPRPNNTGK